MIKRTFVINGVTRTVLVDENETLASFLRERLLLTGCKIGCGEGHCGACNVIVDGKVARSCIMKLSKIKDGAEITTIEGIGTISDMHPLQVAWMAHGCAQCGFCSPGFIMSAKVLLDNNPSPTREEVRDWFNKNRNLCITHETIDSKNISKLFGICFSNESKSYFIRNFCTKKAT